MRVALIVPGGVDRSGERRVIPALLWLMRRLGTQVDLTVFALRQEPRRTRFVVNGVTVENIGGPFNRTRAVTALLAAHRLRPFDVLHAFWAGAPGEIAVTVGALIRCPVVVHIAGGELADLSEIGYGGYRTFHGRARRRFVIRGAAAISAASQTVIDAVERLGRRAERIPLGVGLEDWVPRSPSPRGPHAPVRLVHVGSLNRVKDQATMLHALARLAAGGLNFHLDVVGEDTLGGAMQRLANQLGIGRYVTFRGFLRQRELQPVVADADLHIVSSRHEAGPVVLLEAAVVGVPTVGTEVGQLRDWAPSAAITVPIGNPGALAEAIAGLLEDDARRVAIATAAQDRACREDADWTASRFATLYAELQQGEYSSA